MDRTTWPVGGLDPIMRLTVINGRKILLSNLAQQFRGSVYSVLSDRLIAGRFVSLAGEYAFSIAFPAAVLARTGSVPLAALTVFLEWAPRTLLPLISGRFADSWSLRHQTVLIDGARILAALGVVVHGSVEALFVGAMTIGFFNLWAMVVFERTLDLDTRATTEVERNKRVRRFSLSQTTDRLARIVGAMIASVSLGLDVNLAFVFAVLILFLIGHVISLPLMSTTTPDERDRTKYSLVESIEVTFSSPDIRRLIAILFFLNAVQGMIVATMPSLLFTQFDAAPENIPIFFMMLNVASVCLTAIYPAVSRRFALHLILAFALLSAFCGLVVSIFLPWQWPFMVLVAVSIAMRGWYDIHLRLERNAVVPTEHLGRVLMVFLPIIFLPFALGGLAASLLSVIFSPYQVFVFGAGLSLLGLPFARAFLKCSYQGKTSVS